MLGAPVSYGVGAAGADAAAGARAAALAGARVRLCCVGGLRWPDTVSVGSCVLPEGPSGAGASLEGVTAAGGVPVGEVGARGVAAGV